MPPSQGPAHHCSACPHRNNPQRWAERLPIPQPAFPFEAHTCGRELVIGPNRFDRNPTSCRWREQGHVGRRRRPRSPGSDISPALRRKDIGKRRLPELIGGRSATEPGARRGVAARSRAPPRRDGRRVGASATQEAAAGGATMDPQVSTHSADPGAAPGTHGRRTASDETPAPSRPAGLPCEHCGARREQAGQSGSGNYLPGARATRVAGTVHLGYTRPAIPAEGTSAAFSEPPDPCFYSSLQTSMIMLAWRR